MYLLPKVRQLTACEITKAVTHSHKSLSKPLPGHPVTAQSGSPTYYTGKFIDHILLLPIVKKPRTHIYIYIWDTPHLVRLIESLQVSSDCTLIAYDCTSMYTNMEFNEPMKVVDDALPQKVSRPGLQKTILNTHEVQLLEILLTNNYFTFDNKLYHQTVGVSMGVIPSPEICDIRLYQILESCPKTNHTRTKSKLMPVSEMS